MWHSCDPQKGSPGAPFDGVSGVFAADSSVHECIPDGTAAAARHPDAEELHEAPEAQANLGYGSGPECLRRRKDPEAAQSLGRAGSKEKKQGKGERRAEERGFLSPLALVNICSVVFTFALGAVARELESGRQREKKRERERTIERERRERQRKSADKDEVEWEELLEDPATEACKQLLARMEEEEKQDEDKQDR